MKANNFWGMSRSSRKNMWMIARLGLALVDIGGSLVLAWTLLGPGKGARAIGAVIPLATPTKTCTVTATKTPTKTPTPTTTGTPTPKATPGPVNTTWYFAEGKVGQNFTEYLTIQNPDPVNACNVNLEYLLGTGAPVNKTLTVAAGTRWTEGVNNDLGTPSGSAAYKAVSTIVTVTNATTCKGVVAERPIYFNNISLGNVQHISGADSVVGAPAQANDWRFAEGYTGGGFQENLLLANFGTTSANATVKLEYVNGTTLINTYAIKAKDLVSVDVNYASSHVVGVCAPTPCVLSSSVSAEITTNTWTSIVSEREILFHFDHFDSVINRPLIAAAATDFVGQPLA